MYFQSNLSTFSVLKTHLKEMEAIQTTQRRMHQTKQTTMFDPIR
jgi:hypothetical protein